MHYHRLVRHGNPLTVKQIHRTHGLTKTKVYRAWSTMKDRCANKRNKSFPQYGGRGIMVCDRWLNSFPNFIEDIGFPPTTKHTLDRVDNSLGYSPKNCRWVTWKQQARNRRNNRTLTHNGKTMIAMDWASHLGISVGTLYTRLRRKQPIERVLSVKDHRFLPSIK